MWALGVIAGLLVVAVVGRYLLGRDNVPPMERHLRALEALRDLAEQPRPTIDLTPPPDLFATDHVRILEGAPAGSRPARRAAAKRPAAGARTRRTTKARTAAARADAERPTIQIRPALSALAADPPRARTSSAAPTAPTVPAPLGPFGADEPPPAETPSDPAAPAPPRMQTPGPAPARLLTQRRNTRALVESIPPRALAATAALATVALAVGIVVAAGLTDHHAAATAAKTTHQAAPRLRAAVAPTTTTPPTTVAPKPATVLTRSTSGATVSVHTPFQLTLHANGTCWVQITDTTGHTLYMATLHSGQQQQIPGAGSIVVRLGYTPAVTISVDGVSLDLSGLSQTANVNFQSA